MPKPAPERTRYPLRAVMRRTGLGADVLRAWERRYGAVRPTRSAGGQRLYSADDVERLILLQRATTSGHSISEIAVLDREALETLVDKGARGHLPDPPGAVDAMVHDALATAERLDGAALELTLKRAALSLGSELFLDEALPRFLRSVGDRWHRGSLTPAHEHLASQTVRRAIAWVTTAYDSAAAAPALVVATPASELHELGAMLVAAVAAGEGWRPVYLGPNLPAVDIAAAAEQVDARAVALSLVHSDGDSTLRELRETATRLGDAIPLIIGGMAAVRLERSLADTGIRVLKDLTALRAFLRDRRVPRRADAAAD